MHPTFGVALIKENGIPPITQTFNENPTVEKKTHKITDNKSVKRHPV